MTEKIQKILANLGLGSRRKIEQVIISGMLFINGLKVNIGDRFILEKIKTIYFHKKFYYFKKKLKKKIRMLIYNKPVGEICTNYDINNRDTVFKSLPLLTNQKWISIGRLDLNTSGILLFTNCGNLAHTLMHPSSNLEREYKVRVFSLNNSESKINLLKQGRILKDGFAKFNIIKYESGKGKNKWFTVTLLEGRNREVRRLWQSVNCSVSKLIRIRYGNIVLPPDLKLGHWKELKYLDIHNLIKISSKKKYL
ncbi:Ribosomal large subunit pseudouridine synthase B [Buchnera aphidicola (Eriosoma grossulariae)]|uniref:pseudouridine synthase n=1 Tax=Buchnera aphidicola TaxID=9 RepID=UPI0034639C01